MAREREKSNGMSHTRRFLGFRVLSFRVSGFPCLLQTERLSLGATGVVFGALGSVSGQRSGCLYGASVTG